MRPKSFDEYVGQEHIVEVLKNKEDIPNSLFIGPPGVGKTTLVYILAERKGLPVFEVNASDDRGIDYVRSTLKKYAFSKGSRLILLDEADAMTRDAQQAMRRIIERASEENPGVRFILTCNYPNKIIPPIRSRLANYYFRRLTEKELLTIIIRHLKNIGKTSLSSDEKVAIQELVKLSHGDARFALNQLDAMIDDNMKIHRSVLELSIPPNLIEKSIHNAISGNFGEALSLMKGILTRTSPDELVEKLFDVVQKIDLPQYAKLKLIEKIADFERSIRAGCNPMIQYASLLASVQILKYLSRDL